MVIEELKKLNKEIKKLNDKLSEAEKFKGHFLSNIKNTINNPFTSLVGLSDEIMNIETGDWAKVKKLAALIYGETYFLDFQLNNIICAAELESGELYPEAIRTDIEKQIQNIVNRHQILSEQKNTDFMLSFNPYKTRTNLSSCFITDSRLLELIVNNLIDNAVKFSGDKSLVDIQVSYDKDELNISVKDNGKGIDASDYEMIFDRFSRISKDLDSIQPGHGLGLTVTKGLVELLKGKIEVESSKDGGTIFQVNIPSMKSKELNGLVTSACDEFLFDESDTFELN